jgi:carbonic anhydrase/acetyltransferase-like protein (isoleucine patch superfamily)
MTYSHKYTFIEPDGQRVEGHRHLIPDGSIGGWVAVNATVAGSAFVEAGAIVEPKAIVRPGSRVPAGKTVAYQSTFEQ